MGLDEDDSPACFNWCLADRWEQRTVGTAKQATWLKGLGNMRKSLFDASSFRVIRSKVSKEGTPRLEAESKAKQRIKITPIKPKAGFVNLNWCIEQPSCNQSHMWKNVA